MARTVQEVKIDTRTARSRLAVQHEPYWRLVGLGAHLGYYKGTRGGTWVARWRPAGDLEATKGRGYAKTQLGRADDIEDADGERVLSFEQAQEKALAWFKNGAREQFEDAQRADDRAPRRGPYRVRDAIEDYLEDYERRGGKAVGDARTRADALILPELGDKPVASLTARRLRDWHAGLAKTPARLRTRPGKQQRYRELGEGPEDARRRQATANRVLTTLKAALNHAWKEGLVASDAAWRRVAPFKGVDAARVRYLSKDDCRRLVNACGDDLRPLVRAALLTGCRYSELAALRAEDFNPDGGTVHVRRSKAGKARHVYLDDDGKAFFETATAGLVGDAILFPRADGKTWGRTHQQRPLMEACERAKISPTASFHVLRHTYASHLVMNGVPLPVVAQNLGHADTRMTEKHYAHLAPSYVQDAIRAGAPKLGIGGKGTVTRLRRRASKS